MLKNTKEYQRKKRRPKNTKETIENHRKPKQSLKKRGKHCILFRQNMIETRQKLSILYYVVHIMDEVKNILLPYVLRLQVV